MGGIHLHTAEYESWLGERVPLLSKDIARKHDKMASDPFSFLRGTFYHWLRLWGQTSEHLRDAPAVVSLGDAHIENFGTWRDEEGRLIWGANDFDECIPLPWTQDLVRLAVSACLAIKTKSICIRAGEACDAILDGYTKAINEGGRPFVLEEKHPRLRSIALGELRSPVSFWKKLDALPTLKDPPPAEVGAAFQAAMPRPDIEFRVARRVAGLGTLGRERFVAIAEWRGGRVAREAKALAPSAWWWAFGEGPPRIHSEPLFDSAIRVPDPFVRIVPGWSIRRLAPDCSEIELDALPRDRDEAKLCFVMGYEIGNVHLGTKNARKALMRDIERRPKDWLHDAARDMKKLMLRDFEDWASTEGGDAKARSRKSGRGNEFHVMAM